MTVMSQPLPIGAAASPIPPRHDQSQRLLRLWANLAWRAAAAVAHGTGDETSLLCRQLQVERALTERRLITTDELNELIVWESALIHHDLRTTPRSCLTCRKARVQFPLERPLSMGGEDR